MLCDNCEKDLIRDFIRMSGKSVNCLAYPCYNMKLIDGYYKSCCSKDEIFSQIVKHIQPERSKREDALKECEELGHMNTWMPKGQTLCMRCGTLNSTVT